MRVFVRQRSKSTITDHPAHEMPIGYQQWLRISRACRRTMP
jgi:hypothetical protein